MGKDMPSDFRVEGEDFQCHPQIGAKEYLPDPIHDSHKEKPCSYEATDELIERLRLLLYPCLRSWVYRANVLCWKGQEYDLVEDLLQTALIKIITYLAHARRYAIPIYSLEQLSRVIAKRCFLDLLRRDRRLQHLGPEENELIGREALADPAQQAEENIYEEKVLIDSTRIIATFPPKLRRAILLDLARHSSFTQSPTALQQAFLNVGIDLHEYDRQPVGTRTDRNNQAALCSLAYKRLAQAMAEQEAGIPEEDATCIRENAELTSLALQLQQTRQFVAAPAFYKRLRAQLVASRLRPPLQVSAIVRSSSKKVLVYAQQARDYQITKVKAKELQCLYPQRDEHESLPDTNPAISWPPQERLSAQSEKDNPTSTTPPNPVHFAGHGEPDIPTILNDPELDQLAQLLRAAATPVSIDPAFKDTLLKKLLEKLRQQTK